MNTIFTRIYNTIYIALCLSQKQSHTFIAINNLHQLWQDTHIISTEFEDKVA